MKKVSLFLVVALLLCGKAWAAVTGVEITAEFVDDKPVDPMQMMAEKERRDVAEIARLNARITEMSRRPAQQRIHKSVLVPMIDHPELVQEPEPIKREKLRGPSLGYQGPRKKVKSYSGSTQETWSWMPPQVRYQ